MFGDSDIIRGHEAGLAIAAFGFLIILGMIIHIIIGAIHEKPKDPRGL